MDVENSQRMYNDLMEMRQVIADLLDNQNYDEPSQMQHEKIVVDKSSIDRLGGLVNKMTEDIAKERLKETAQYKSRVQIYIPKRTETTESFIAEAKILFEGISSERIICREYSELCEDYHLVVVCSISSRIMVDIDSAVEHITYKKPFVVLLLHSCIRSAMPRVPTSTKLDMKKYQNIKFIDIASSMENKLYVCELNEKANQMLKRYVDRSSICLLL